MHAMAKFTNSEILCGRRNGSHGKNPRKQAENLTKHGTKSGKKCISY
jgi:hypothetical protein